MAALTVDFPELPAVVEQFKHALRDNVKLTRLSLDGDGSTPDFSGLWGHMLDYPQFRGAGKRRFRVAYFAPPDHKANPWQRFTLVSIVKQKPNSDGEDADG